VGSTATLKCNSYFRELWLSKLVASVFFFTTFVFYCPVKIDGIVNLSRFLEKAVLCVSDLVIIRKDDLLCHIKLFK